MEHLDSSSAAGMMDASCTWKESAQSAAGYLRGQLERVDTRIGEVTGRSLESWTADARKLLREHPVQTAAVMLGLGYVLGKVAFRD